MDSGHLKVVRQALVHTKGAARNTAGEVTALLGLSEELAGRELTGHGPAASRDRHRHHFESATDGLLILDAVSGAIIDANPSLLQLLGYSRQELVGRPLWESGLFADLAASRQVLARLQTEGYLRYDDLSLRTRTGRDVDVELVSSVYMLGNRDVIECRLRDISSRMRAETERDRLTMAIDQSAEVVVVTDLLGQILYTNPAFERVTGYTCQEALGRSSSLLNSGVHDQNYYHALWATIGDGRTWNGRMVNKKKDGTLYTADASISPVRALDGTITSYVNVQRDISASLALEAQFRHAQKMESIGRLAGGVAHDFNNILTVILSYADFSIQQSREGEPLREDLIEILKAGKRAATLTRQLLAFSRKQVLQPVALDLNQVLTGVESMLRRVIGEDIDLVVVQGPELGPVSADPGQIEQILLNLVVNARDAMPEGGRLTIATRNVELTEADAARQADARAGSYVLLSVVDDGMGMDEDTRNRIFEPFFTTKEKGKGTGLGLPMVYGTVKQSGGNILVASEPGRGTTFDIYLPRESVARNALVNSAPRISTRAARETVLVVEDNDAIRRVAMRILRAAGYTVLGAADGSEALALSIRHEAAIDLLLTDMVMPRMSGHRLAQTLAETRPEIAVLYMSGHSDDGLVAQGVLDAGSHFIGKPFRFADLSRKVGEVLDNRAAARKAHDQPEPVQPIQQENEQ